MKNKESRWKDFSFAPVVHDNDIGKTQNQQEQVEVHSSCIKEKDIEIDFLKPDNIVQCKEHGK